MRSQRSNGRPSAWGPGDEFVQDRSSRKWPRRPVRGRQRGGSARISDRIPWSGPSSGRRSTVTHTESERRPGQESPDAVRTSGTPSRGEAGPATHLRCPDFPLPLLSCAKRQRMIRCLPTVGRDSFHGAHRVSHDVIPKPVGISCRRSQEQRRFGNLLGGASGRTHFVGSYLDAPPRGIPACTETPVRENRIRTGKIHRPGEGFKCRINRLVPRRARSDGGGVQAEHWF